LNLAELSIIADAFCLEREFKRFSLFLLCYFIFN